MDCYAQFASIYDDLINEDIDYIKWSEVILSICEEYKLIKENYLDLACGTGNITKEIYKSFKRTYAVDLSDEMLVEAREKLDNPVYKPKFICQDICDLHINEKFDLITCALDGTNYILEEEKLSQYFNNVSSLLKENGIFIFDINSYYKLSEVLGNNIFNYDSDDVTYIWDNYFEEEKCYMNLTFFVRNLDDRYSRFDESHVERAYKEDVIEKILKNCNLKILKKLNNYEDIAIDEKSERIVYVVKRVMEE